MNVVTGLSEVCLRSAARRWPDAIRTEIAAEWQAELATLRRTPHLHPLVRAWRELTFAASLACSPSVEGDRPMTITWRDRLPGLGLAARRLALLAAVAVLAPLAAQSADELWYQISTHNSAHPLPSTGIDVAGTLAAVALAIAVTGLAGRVAARFTPLAGRIPGHLRRAAFVVAPIAVVRFVTGSDTFGPVLHGRSVALAIIVWAVVASAAGAATARAATTGRPVVAWVVGSVGMLVAADLAGALAGLSGAHQVGLSAISAPAWLPLSLLPFGVLAFGGTPPAGNPYLSGDDVHASDIPVMQAGGVAVPLLLCSAFILVYLLRDRSVPLAVPVAAPVEAPIRRPVAHRPVRVCAAVAAVAGVALWVYGAALASFQRYEADQLSLAAEVRLGAIVLAVLGLVVVVAGRGPVTAPAVAVLAVLVGLDRLAFDHAWHGAGPAAGLAAAGIGLLAGAWWVSGRLAGPGTTDTSARRGLAGVAIVAALAVPVDMTWSDVLAHRLTDAQIAAATQASPNGFSIPFHPALWISVTGIALGIVLTALAFTAAYAARRTPPGGSALAVLIAVGAAVLALATTGAAESVRQALYWPDYSFFYQPVLATVVVALVRWRRGARPWVAATWVLAGLGVAAASVPLSQPVKNLAGLAGTLLLPLLFGPGPQALGPTLVGVLLAVLLGPWLIRPPQPTVGHAPTPEPIPTPATTAGRPEPPPQPAGLAPATP